VSGDEASLAGRALARFTSGTDVRRQAADSCVGAIVRTAQTVAKALANQRKILLCGNGGSAADCQHLATEFVGRLTREFERPALPAIALTVDSSFLTAHANDYGFAGVFERQIEALGQPGDVLIGITTSGSSANILRAIAMAKRRDMAAVMLTGAAANTSQADIVIAVPSTDTQHIQETHLAIEHILCDLVERILYAGDPRLEGAAS